MRCPRCGLEVSEQQKFCHDCGASLARPLHELPTQPIDVVDPPLHELPTQPIDVVDPPLHELPTQPIDVVPTTPVETLAPPRDVDRAEPAPVEAASPTVTAEMPALFDGHDDLVEYPEARKPFQLRVVFLLAIFGMAAMLMTFAADMVDLRTTRPAPGIVTGPRALEDLGTNLGIAGLIGTAVMVLGGLLACFGLRWGAGLAGGAGLAVAGWAGLTIGLAEFPIAVAESITRTSSVEFTLRVTRDLGWWLVLGVGVVGVVVFVASLRSIGSGGRPALNPVMAAVTAVAAVVLGFGPLVPVNGASFADNFRSVDPARDLPTAFFAGRLGQVALIMFAGALGMLLVRSYGLGLAAGGISASIWLWVASFAEIGANPVGIADRNPGADDTMPHSVTTVGMIATLALLVLAASIAAFNLRRGRQT